MLDRILRLTNGQNTAMQKALRDLDEEVDLLDENDELLTGDNAHLEKALNAMAGAWILAGKIVNDYTPKIEASGLEVAPVAVTAKVFSQITGKGNPVMPDKLAGYIKQLDLLGVNWTAPSGVDYARAYTESAAWSARMAKWGDGYSELIKKSVLEGIQNGWGPKYTAGKLRHLVETMPKYAAENLTRTLQITSYRDGCLAMEQMNGEFIEYKIRIAELDDKTCLSCIDLHGTRLEKGERVDDHFGGRCSDYLVTVGGPRFPAMMQSDSTPGNRNFVPFTDGKTWLAGLPPDRLAQQASFVASPAKLRAYQDGVSLSEFSGTHIDSVFGRQTVEKSLVGALGDGAKQYYSGSQED